LDATRTLRFKFEEIDAALKTWFDGIETIGGADRFSGSKAMKANDRVALVLPCNYTGSHKIPVAVIGAAAVPLCLKAPRSGCLLPYVSQTSAWLDGEVYKKWFQKVFLRDVRERTRSRVNVVVDTCGAHNALESDSIKFCPFPPSLTSAHRPLDDGILACLKRRYEKRQI